MSRVACSSPTGQHRCSAPSAGLAPPKGFARLELVINGTRYKVQPTEVGTISEVKSWRLRKADGTIHIVSQEIDGHLCCTCLDFVSRRSSRSRCKHILSLLAVGLLTSEGGAAK